MTSATLTFMAVYCVNAFCPYALKKGKPIIVGKITEAGELRCPSCRQVVVYHV